MAEQNPIRYQDLISPDESIQSLISQLEKLQEVYGKLSEDVKQKSKDLADSLQKVSGATEQGRKSIKNSSSEASKLEQAYKKLDEAMSANEREIRKLNQAKRDYINYSKNMQRRGAEEIRTAKQIQSASYNQLSAQYALNKAYLNSLSSKDREIKKNKELLNSTRAIYEQMKKLQAETGKMQLNVGNYPDVKSILGSVIGVTSVTGGAIAAISALKQGVTTAMDFQHQLSGLAAILGTTTDKIKDLTDQARELGATTIFTAQEVVQLQTELAKLGYSTDDILSMTKGVLSFAQATGASLADAASLTGAALRMFEQDTSHTQEFVDKMAAATNKSALSFSYLQNALSTVSPVANAFGFKLEEVLALLGQLANAGFDASSAATATRNILLYLADANGKLAKALGEPVKDLDGLVAGLVKLDKKGIDLAETLELTDKRSVAAFNTFLSGASSVSKLRDELNLANGTAAEMAKTMGDNLAGDTKTLQSAWQDLMIEINEGQGVLRDAVGWMTKLVRLWKNYIAYSNGTREKREKADKEIEQFARNRYLANIDPSTVKPLEATIYRPVEEETDKEEKKTTSKEKKLTEAELKEAKRRAEERKRKQEQQKKAQEAHQKDMLTLRRKYEDTLLEVIEDEGIKEQTKIAYKYDREREDLRAEMEKKKKDNLLSLKDEELYNKQLAELEKAKNVNIQKAIAERAKKNADQLKKQKQEQAQALQMKKRDEEQLIEMQYRTDMEGIEMLETSEKEKTRLRLEAEKKRLQALLKLYKADGTKLTEAERALIQKQIEAVDSELAKNDKRGDIYDILGFNLSDEKKEAIDTSLSYAMESLNSFVDAWAEAANKKREVADAEVERTQNVLEAELEARNKGYANEVDTARKELELARKNQQKAIAQQKRAQMAQIAIDTASQASNLITASSLIWKQLGFPWAIPALGLMWASFAAAKVQAIQAVSSMNSGTEKYAEGTVELLEGGSHQSGHDIDLGRKADGTRRRAEGGEYFAVINKRNSRRYGSLIPDVINSLNSGTFAEKYMNAYGSGNITIEASQSRADLTMLNDNVEAIREQGENRVYTDGNGNTVLVYKNLKRTVRR